MSSFCLLSFPPMCNPSIPSSLSPHPFLLPFLHLILLFFLPPLASLLSLNVCFLVLFFTFSPIFFFIDLSVSLLFPQVYLHHAGIKEVFVSSTETACSVFSAPALCSCSRKKPNEHITESVKYMYMYSTCATVCLHYST